MSLSVTFCRKKTTERIWKQISCWLFCVTFPSSSNILLRSGYTVSLVYLSSVFPTSLRAIFLVDVSDPYHMSCPNHLRCCLSTISNMGSTYRPSLTALFRILSTRLIPFTAVKYFISVACTLLFSYLFTIQLWQPIGQNGFCTLYPASWHSNY